MIYEDEHFVVINKPAGIEAQYLLGLGLDNSWHLVNRLDQRVSGLMVIAKNSETAASLQRTWRDTVKKYRCISKKKEPMDAEGLLESNLLKKNQKSLVVSADMKDSLKCTLHYKILQTSERYQMMEISLETGRFHQIRAQMAHIGCPLVGDLKYGYPRSTPDGSIFLQSYFLKLTHPVSQQELAFTLPLPTAWVKLGFNETQVTK